MFEGNAATVIGKRVGNYVVERTLAQGGMGAVFVARHPALGREAAVKFLGQDFESPPELTKRFLDEARITASLRHPNIVDIFDFGELDGRLYYVMELLEGRDLSALMHSRGSLSADEAIDFLEQICSGLAVAHAVGVVHRDLKPGNIFIVRGDRPRLKLMDFGIAKIINTNGEQTRYGQIIGTPRYMSPEQALGQVDRITPQSDFYSLGVIAYEMVAGVAPFEHESPVMLLAMHIRDNFRPLRELVPGVPAPLAELVEACLSKNPGNRPQSAQEILEQLASIRRRSGIERLDAGPPPQTASGEHRPREPAKPRNAVLGSTDTQDAISHADTVVGTSIAHTSSVHLARQHQPPKPPEPEASYPAEPPLAPARPTERREHASDPSTASPSANQKVPAASNANARHSATVRVAERSGNERNRTSPTDRQGATPKSAAAETPDPRNTPATRADAATLLPATTDGATGELAAESKSVVLTETDQTTLNRLLSRMQKRADFPAFVQNVGEVSKRADFESSFSAGQLGSSILKDYALTAKLLRIVNSLYANRFGGKVYSVQHAIVILGFDRVRSLALSTSLFKKQGNKEHAERITESAINSLVSGEIARQLHTEVGLEDPEQATVCSMFRNLGRHLVLVYLPEQYDQIVNLAQTDGIGTDLAAERVLGISLHKLGVGIAERWRLPRRIIGAMRTVPDRIGDLKREEDKLSSLANFSNQLCEIVASQASDEERSAAIRALLGRNRKFLQLDPDDVTNLLKTTQESFEQRYATLLGGATKTCRFSSVVTTIAGQGNDAPGSTGHLATIPVAPPDKNATYASAPHPPGDGNTAKGPPVPVAVRPERGKPQVARIQLARQIEPDLPECGAETSALNTAGAQALVEFGRSGSSEQLLNSLLATLAKHLEVPRILALRARSNRRALAIVGGVGDDVDGLAKQLNLPLTPGRGATDPFSLSYHSNRDFFFDDVFAPKAIAQLPQRYYEAIGSTSLAILAASGKGAQPLLVTIDLEPPLRLPSQDLIADLQYIRPILARIAPPTAP